MARYHIQNAPSFNTLREEKLFQLWRASKTGRLPVDQKRCPPSNRGVVKQMIADGLLGQKTGSSVPLTEKGRAYMRRHGWAEYKHELHYDTGLDDDDIALASVLRHALYGDRTVFERSIFGGYFASLIERGFVTIADVPEIPQRVSVYLNEPALDHLAAAGDKRIRKLIEKADHDPFLRANYAKQSLAQLISDYREVIETLERRWGSPLSVHTGSVAQRRK